MVGCRFLGGMYESGLGVTKDESKAATLYQRGCDASDGSACISLGLMYSQGRGVKTDPVKARALFDKACTAGLARGCQLRDK
jgi:TPR repeat protein